MGGFDGSFEGQQRVKALHRANRVRLARAEVKQRIRTGAVPAADVIQECPCELANMSVSDILMSQKRWGETRCRRLLLSVSIPEDKRIGTLTDRQREALVRTLGGTVPGEGGPNSAGAAPDRPRRPKAPAPTAGRARQLSAV